MSKMVMRSNRKPPLPKSPTRLLPLRSVLRSTQNTAPSPPPASSIRTPLAKRSPNVEKTDLRPEYQTISCEILALAKLVRDEFGKPDFSRTESGIPFGTVSNPVFQRGKYYDEYCARRNERLKRKRGENEEERENKTDINVNVGVESAQKMVPKRHESAKKGGVVSTPMREKEVGNSRYMLRSMNKENKKPPLPVKYEGSAIGKSVTRRARKI